MVAATGWTWDYCEDTLTLARITQLFEEWQSFPPVHEAVARFLGYKKKSYGDLTELMGMFPTGTIGGPPTVKG